MTAGMIVARVVFFAAAWWILSGGSTYTWFVGAAVVILAVLTSLRLHPRPLMRVSITGLLAFLGFFLLRSFQGGVQVAVMALRPRMNLNPGVLEFRLRLPQEGARLFLVSILSLLPGTLSASLNGNRLQLHVLDMRMPIEQEVHDAEACVARLFNTELT